MKTVKSEPKGQSIKSVKKLASKKESLDRVDVGIAPAPGIVRSDYISKPQLERDLALKKHYYSAVAGHMPNNVNLVYDVSNAEIDNVKRIAAEEDLYNFEAYLFSQIDVNDPAQRDLLYRTYPDIMDRQTRKIEQVIDLQKRVARLKTHGPRTADDWYLKYLIDTGQIVIPDKAPWDTSDISADEKLKALGRMNFAKYNRPIKTYRDKKFYNFRRMEWGDGLTTQYTTGKKSPLGAVTTDASEAFKTASNPADATTWAGLSRQ